MLCQVLVEPTEHIGLQWKLSESSKMFRNCAECRSSRKAPIPFAFYPKYLLFHTYSSPRIERYSVWFFKGTNCKVICETKICLEFLLQYFSCCHPLFLATPITCKSSFLVFQLKYSTPDKTWQRDSRNAVAVRSFSFYMALYLSKNFQSVIMKHHSKSC